jgi:hypothetical protein
VPLNWSLRSDSNRRPAHYECAALPTELPRRSGRSRLAVSRDPRVSRTSGPRSCYSMWPTSWHAPTGIRRGRRGGNSPCAGGSGLWIPARRRNRPRGAGHGHRLFRDGSAAVIRAVDAGRPPLNHAEVPNGNGEDEARSNEEPVGAPTGRPSSTRVVARSGPDEPSGAARSQARRSGRMAPSRPSRSWRRREGVRAPATLMQRPCKDRRP